MGHIAPGMVFSIDSGPFAGMEATVREVRGEHVLVDVVISGRKTPLTLPISQVRAGDEDPRPGLWKAVEADRDRSLTDRFGAFWAAHLDTPEPELAGLFDRAVAFQTAAQEEEAIARAAVRAELDAAYPDQTLAELGAAGLRERFRAEAARWTPRAHARDEGLARFQRLAAEDDWNGVGPEPTWYEERRQWMDASGPNGEAIRALKLRAQAAAESKRHAARQRTERQHGIDAAMALAERLRPRVRATHGVELPDHLFTFWAFLSSLTDAERVAFDGMHLEPAGILDARFRGEELPDPIDGLDHRLHDRYYRDPPELITVLTGDSDGLHFGLFYDDPITSQASVSGSYARDSAELASHQPTLLCMVRKELENREGHARTEARQHELRTRLALLRAAVMDFETVERQEQGWDYVEKYSPVSPDRVPTLDRGGVLAVPVPGGFALPRDHEGLRVIYEAITGDQPVVGEWIARAHAACAAGDAAFALALGRDLHWASGGVAAREDAAVGLLVAAYVALGRPALADIARVHHRHRGLANVDMYR